MKILKILLMLVFITFISACNNDLSEEEIENLHNQAYEIIKPPISTTQDLDFPEVLNHEGYEITISWVSSHPSIVSHTGVVTRPSFEQGNQQVTLTITFSLNDIETVLIHQITVVALDEIILLTFTVQFETNGGNSILELVVNGGSQISQPSVPVKSGFTFIGWYSDSGLTIPYIFSTPITSNLTLYAKWEIILPETFGVSFESNGGSAIFGINVNAGGFIIEPTDPTKEGYLFVGWYKESSLLSSWDFLADTVNANLTLYAKWEEVLPETFIVSFESNGGSTISDLEIEENELIDQPVDPVKEGFTFVGWYKDVSLLTTWDFFIDIVISDITLYAKWEEVIVLEGTAISTAAEFNSLSNSGAIGTYYLANDIDFSSHVWTYVNFNFQGTLNGNGKTLSNLTITGTDRTGIFSRAKNTTIYDLFIDNAHITASNRAGILIGEADGDNVNLSEITITNSSVTGNSSNGVGGVIGYTKPGFTVIMDQISIQNSNVSNTSSAAGGIIGMTDGGTVTLSNLEVLDVHVTASNRAGGIYGEIKGSVNISISYAILNVDILTALYLGGVVGRNQAASGVSIANILISGRLESTNSNFGHISGDLPISSVTNVYIAGLSLIGTLNKQNVGAEFIVQDLESINQAWWNNQLLAFTTNSNWYYESGLYHLVFNQNQSATYAITLIFGHEIPDGTLTIMENQKIQEPDSVVIIGFELIGWYMDSNFINVYDFNLLVTSTFTLYAKWDELPKYTVTIDSTSYEIYENQKVEQPLDPMVEGQVFLGWFIGGNEFDFDTPITENYTITSQFRAANSFTITFNSNGGSAIGSENFYENEEVAELESPILINYYFIGWFLDEDLSLPFDIIYLEANITLYAKYILLSEMSEFNLSDYNLNGFAVNHVSIPNLVEGNPGYYVVTTPLELMNAINAENSSSLGTTSARIIEIRADLNMGYLEVTNQYGTLRNFESHTTPKIHPILMSTGVGKIVIQDRDGTNSKYNEGLVIFSESGHTIKHAAFSIKRSNNIVVRNLKFDELWEWDEATKGDYDSNDWDYFTIDTVNGIWFDHIELGKAYDGLIDFKAGDSIDQTVKNATFSYMKLVFTPNDFIRAQINYLEANKSSFSYYNLMRTSGMSVEEIVQLSGFQKKGFLLGGSELRVGNVFTLTIYNSYIKNLQDRFPRLRGGDVHLFNNIYDATEVYEMKSQLTSAYPVLFAKTEYNRLLTNQALITTENGAILMENSIIMGVTQVIKSNQVGTNHPIMTGKYKVIDSIYILDEYEFLGGSEDLDTPFIRSNSEPVLPFSWTTFTVLPYSSYRIILPNHLSLYLDQAILGVTSVPFNWLTLNQTA